MVERAMIGALGVLADPSGADIAPWERLTRITERRLQGLVVHPEYMLVMIQSLVSQDAPPQTGKLMADLGQQFSARLAKIIQAGQAAGEVVQGDPQELVAVFLAAIQGLALTQFTQGFFTQAAPPRESARRRACCAPAGCSSWPT